MAGINLIISYALLLVLSNFASAAVDISGSAFVPLSFGAFSPETEVCLDNAINQTCVLTRKSGEFTFSAVEDGDYVLGVVSNEFRFASARIKVSDDQVACFEYVPGTDWNYLGLELPYPIVLEAIEKYIYYVPRQSFSIFSILFSPYILLMGFGLAMVLFMPKMMKSMADPELLAELQRTQQSSSGGESNDQPELPSWALKFAESMGVQLPAELDKSKAGKKKRG